jgi:hypothetical protein
VIIGVSFDDKPPVDVGQTAAGSTIDLVTTVTGDPGYPVRITAVTVTGAAFSLVQDGCTGQVVPDPCTVTIAATPPAAGEYIGDLAIQYEDPTTGSDTTGDRLVVVGL